MSIGILKPGSTLPTGKSVGPATDPSTPVYTEKQYMDAILQMQENKQRVIDMLSDRVAELKKELESLKETK